MPALPLDGMCKEFIFVFKFFEISFFNVCSKFAIWVWDIGYSDCSIRGYRSFSITVFTWLNTAPLIAAAPE